MLISENNCHSSQIHMATSEFLCPIEIQRIGFFWVKVFAFSPAGSLCMWTDVGIKYLILVQDDSSKQESYT